MNPSKFLHKSQDIIRQRNFVLALSIFALVSNVILACKLLLYRERIILIPHYDLAQQIVLDGKNIPEKYLVDWSSSILSDLFTVNRHTVDRKNTLFLEISSSAERLKDTVANNAKRIKQDGMSTVFYPKSFKLDRANRKVLVGGTFMAYFGRDKNPVVYDKTYALGWREAANGCVLVESLEEVGQ